MDTFEELEKRYPNEPVTLSGGRSGSGVLAIAGGKSQLRITTDLPITGDAENGWFDLVLEQTNGRRILVHNALLTSVGTPHPQRNDWEQKIFPNIVAFDAEAILPRGTVRSLRFQLDGFEEIFHYELVEWQSLHGAPTDVLRSIRGLRKIKRPYPRDYERFDPDDVFIIHRSPKPLQFALGDKSYEIFVGQARLQGRTRLTVSQIVIATIKFSEPVPLDEALDSAWTWRRFFQQLTMTPLPFRSISCSGRTNRRIPHCSLYLPNLESEKGTALDLFPFNPSNLPFGQWKDRASFAEVMRRWLELDQKRRLFRVRLDRVIEESRESASPRLIAELCNAVDTLAEFRKGGALKKQSLDIIVQAAEKAANDAGIPIGSGRIRGVLGMLQNRSLPQKLIELASSLPNLPPADTEKVMKCAQRFRTFDAHGDRWDEMTMPLVGPTLEALTSICVLWDQTTSGMPIREGGRELLAAKRAAWNIRETCQRMMAGPSGAN